MEVIVKVLSELRRPDKNIRRHTEKQMAEYIRSITMFGQTKPIVIDETGEIIIGNGLYEALLRMGVESCDCYVMAGLTTAQKRKLMLADNRVYELGITDMDIFDEIVKELEGDIDIPGWDADLLETINASLEEADDIVENYGVFEPEEIEAVSRRQREEHTSGRPSVPSPTPSPSPEQENPVPSTNEATSLPQESVPTRTIVCPHCGGTICL